MLGVGGRNGQSGLCWPEKVAGHRKAGGVVEGEASASSNV